MGFFGNFAAKDLESACLQLITYKNIGLQFYTSHLKHAWDIKAHLESIFKDLNQGQTDQNINFFILSDTARSPCCVDFITSDHIPCDAILHFGESCGTEIRQNGPKVVQIDEIFNVRDQKAFETELKTGILSISGAEKGAMVSETPKTIICWDTPFNNFLTPADFSEIFAETLSRKKNLTKTLKLGKKYENLIWVGHDGKFLQNFVLANNFQNVYFLPKFASGDLKDSKCDFLKSSCNGDALLRQRYHFVLSLREAKVVAVVVTSFASEKSVRIVDYCRKTLREAGKRVHVVNVGKITDPKLGNFVAVDLFVNVSCPLNFCVAAKAFGKLVANPLDVQFAFERDWSAEDYFFDADALLEPRPKMADLGPKSETSLIQSEGRVLAKDQIAEIKAEIQKMAFFGVENPVGDAKPSFLEKGLHGIANDYTETT